MFSNVGTPQYDPGFEAIGNVLHNNFLWRPPFGAGWVTAFTGSGADGSSWYRLYISTGITATSTSKLHMLVQGLDRATTNVVGVDWSKKLWIMADLARQTSVANSVAYFQLKGVSTIGDLAAKGLGVKIADLAISSESYGTARGSTTLNTTMTSTYIYHVGILLDPAVPNIKYYVNGTLQYTETTAANIPSSGTTNDPYLVLSVDNGGTAASALLFADNITLWQKQGS